MFSLKQLIRRFKSPLSIAKKEGMNVGKNVTVMGGVTFGSEPYLITLKDNVRISGRVTFITHDGGSFSFRHKDEFKDVNRFGKIVIDEYSFIGSNSIIMPNVHIGKNCVVAAGAIVTKSVPDGCVVSGIPAKVICTTEEYANKMKSKMPTNWNVDEYLTNKKAYLIKTIPSPEAKKHPSDKN